MKLLLQLSLGVLLCFFHLSEGSPEPEPDVSHLYTPPLPGEISYYKRPQTPPNPRYIPPTRECTPYTHTHTYTHTEFLDRIRTYVHTEHQVHTSTVVKTSVSTVIYPTTVTTTERVRETIEVTKSLPPPVCPTQSPKYVPPPPAPPSTCDCRNDNNHHDSHHNSHHDSHVVESQPVVSFRESRPNFVNVRGPTVQRIRPQSVSHQQPTFIERGRGQEEQPKPFLNPFFNGNEFVDKVVEAASSLVESAANRLRRSKILRLLSGQHSTDENGWGQNQRPIIN